jgi:TPP-dependent pyruvate/acetoin dehydrogenase alpha subunit
MEFARRLEEQGVADPATLRQIDQEVESAIEEAIEFAKNSPLPKPEDALLNVFSA